MAVKTFGSERLTSPDINTYLANSGLVQVTSGVTVTSVGGTAATVSNGSVIIGSGNTSITVSGAFSSTYDNYRIMMSGGSGSTADANIQMTLGASATGYSEAVIYNTYAVNTPIGVSRANQTQWVWMGNTNVNQNVMNVDLFGPFLTAHTYYRSYVLFTPTAQGSASGTHTVATSYSSFTLTPGAGTFNSGTIVIYGYRKV